MTDDEINEALRPIFAAHNAELLAGVEMPEPERYEYQASDGSWHPFLNEKHKADTEADGSWPIRPLFTIDQLQAYAAAAALNARMEVLEEAKGVCLHKQVNGNYSHDTRYECAAAIEQLKGKV